MMYLKKDIDKKAFLKEVARCTGEVNLYTAEGDELNMKSVFCRFIFMVVGLHGTEVVCAEQEDITRLAVFLTDAVELA